MAEDWTASAREELRGLQVGATGWAYRRGATPSVEPSALACLGLLAVRPDAGAGADRAAARSGADWLAAIQRPAHCRRAADWLLRQKGDAYPRSIDPDHIVGHDTSLIGWPWVAATHSWVEPTVMAILALGREGYRDHPRVLEGVRLIHDRALPAGGWNYGNKSAFGHALRPQPGPTGLALLALARRRSRSEMIERAIAYLNATLPGVRAPASLGWGLLGLRAWDSLPAEAGRWLADSFAGATGRPDAAPRLASLLLAAGQAALDLLID